MKRIFTKVSAASHCWYRRSCRWAFWWRIGVQMRRRNLIFVHVPRAAGTSISSALFGPRNTLHHSIRYYKTVHPRFYAAAESFAVLREPFDRFASSYVFVRAGGTKSCRLSDFFIAETAHVRSVDDYLCYLEERDVLATDFVMRPQSWFVCTPAHLHHHHHRFFFFFFAISRPGRRWSKRPVPAGSG